MPKAIFSKQLLTEIRNGTWQEPELDLSAQQLDAAAAQDLANALAKNNYIQSLNLSNNEIGDKGAAALAQNTTLWSLNLTDNIIGDAGATALAQNTTLTSLHLGLNLFSEGFEALIKNPSLASLTTNLDNIQDDNAIDSLLKNRTLVSLDFNGAADDEIKKIEERMKRLPLYCKSLLTDQQECFANSIMFGYRLCPQLT